MHSGNEPKDTIQKNQLLECQFGSVSYQEHEIIHFADGIYGFEQYKQFLLWENSKYVPFQWLICLENPKLVFPVVDPILFYPDYLPNIDHKGGVPVLLAVVTIGETTENVTANLRAPIIIDVKNRIGRQAILTDTKYPLRYRIIKNNNG
jgi:flagellar assembly factor FliW